MVLHAAVVELFNDPVLTALDSGFVAAALAGCYELVMGVENAPVCRHCSLGGILG